MIVNPFAIFFVKISISALHIHITVGKAAFIYWTGASNLIFNGIGF